MPATREGLLAVLERWPGLPDLCPEGGSPGATVGCLSPCARLPLRRGCSRRLAVLACRRAGRWAGYCGGLLRRKVVLCRGLSEWLPSTLEHLTAREAPPEDVGERVEAELVPVLIDREAEAPDRRLAIRSMSRTGYPWRADALIAVLGDPDESLRTEARRALENMAGELLGPDPAAWRDWLCGLPDGAVAIARDPA